MVIWMRGHVCNIFTQSIRVLLLFVLGSLAQTIPEQYRTIGTNHFRSMRFRSMCSGHITRIFPRVKWLNFLNLLFWFVERRSWSSR